MSTNAGTAVAPGKAERTGAESPFGLFFELEWVALNGRRAAFDVLQGMLKEQKTALTTLQFARHGLHPSPAHYLPGLLAAIGHRKGSTEKLAEDLSSGIVMQLTTGDAALRPGLLPLLAAARARNVSLVALTTLPDPAAQSIMEKFDLVGAGVRLFNFAKDVDEIFPRADTWMKMAKALHKMPRRCLALVSSAASCRSALAAGMRSVVITDEFTQHQDFGGANLVVDSLTDLAAEDLFVPIGAPVP